MSYSDEIVDLVYDKTGGYCRIRAFVEYGEPRAPDLICQKAYEAGVFPIHSLE